MTVRRTITLDDLTPVELAMLFCDFDSEQQADFFDAVGEISSQWGGMGWCGQCAQIVDDLTPRAARTIETLAGHVADKGALGMGGRV